MPSFPSDAMSNSRNAARRRRISWTSAACWALTTRCPQGAGGGCGRGLRLGRRLVRGRVDRRRDPGPPVPSQPTARCSVRLAGFSRPALFQTAGTRTPQRAWDGLVQGPGARWRDVPQSGATCPAPASHRPEPRAASDFRVPKPLFHPFLRVLQIVS